MKKILIAICLISLIFLTACSMGSNNSGNPVAKIKTNYGTIAVVLYADKAPETVKNFVTLAKEGKYDETIFHRIIEGFMIQGGDFEKGDGTGGYSYKGPGTTLDDEVNPELKHVKGALSMAKTAAPNTAGSQFFIVQAEEGTPHLDGVHTVFGMTIDGLDVVDKIAGVEIGMFDAPAKEVVIESITIEE